MTRRSDTPNSATDPSAAVIVPHFNDHARLERCLAALGDNDLAGTEVVVVDNGSTPDPAALVGRFSFARLVSEPARGAAAARNRGVRETQAPVLLFLDADCVPSRTWVASGRALAGDAGVIGGRIDVFRETEGEMSGAEAFETVFAFQQRAYVEKKGFSVTANLVTTRALFEETGDFIVGLSEDMDWCRRAQAKGATLLYADDLRVAHPARTDWPALRKKWRRMTEEGFALQGSGTRARLIWLARALLMPFSILAHAPRILRAPQLDGPMDRARALATLARLRFARSGWMIRQVLTGHL